MNRAWLFPAKILTGVLVSAVYALPQAYTISAKPGVVNYVEGDASLNGRPISPHNLKAVFLNTNDTISTGIGKAEVLLAPGVFLRLGENSQVRMISPSLSDTQIEVKSGEAMVEADNIVQDSRVSVIDHGSSVVIDRDGLYKFTGGDDAKAAVLEGKAAVYFGDRKVDVGKGHEVSLVDAGKAHKFDMKKGDDLYAWSNVRAEYNAASSYQAAKDVNAGGYGGVWGGYGFSGFTNPGWFWNSGFDSWAWLPGNGIFASPFGYGFYGPGLVGYAPVVYAPLYGGGGGYYGGTLKRPMTTSTTAGASKVVAHAAVPVNPVRPAAIGTVVASPAANEAARSAAVRSFASAGGFRTATGAVVPAGRAAASASTAASAPASSGFSGAHSSGGFSSGAHSAGGISGASAGGAGGGHGSGGGGGHH